MKPEHIEQFDHSAMLADFDFGPWALLNDLSALSEANDQSVKEFQRWCRRLADLAALMGGES